MSGRSRPVRAVLFRGLVLCLRRRIVGNLQMTSLAMLRCVLRVRLCGTGTFKAAAGISVISHLAGSIQAHIEPFHLGLCTADKRASERDESFPLNASLAVNPGQCGACF